MPKDDEGKYQMVYRKCRIGYEKNPTLRDGEFDLLLQPRPRTPCS
jgi:hypothetical protein